MTEQRARLRITEKEGRDSEQMPLVFEGTLFSETTDNEGVTWIRLTGCSPGVPERLVRRGLCESVEQVEGDSG